jgi:hypothetical protein
MNAKMKVTTLALALACAAPAAHAQTASAPDRFRLELRYDRAETAAWNYARFRRLAREACSTPGLQPIDAILRQKACVAGVMDSAVSGLNRADLAIVHARETGRPAEAPRDYALAGR